jgi:hypothetical protein
MRRTSKGHEKLSAKVVLTTGGVSLSPEIGDEIELGQSRCHRSIPNQMSAIGA